jgi:hypothetical protein
MLSCRTFLTEYTYVSPTIGRSQSVRFGWSLLSSWRDQGVWPICSNREVAYWRSSINLTVSETHSHKTCNSRLSPLFKLWMSVTCCSRWKFNLTVSIKTLVYQTIVGRGKVIMRLWDLVGDCWNFWALKAHHVNPNNFNKISKSH